MADREDQPPVPPGAVPAPRKPAKQTLIGGISPFAPAAPVGPSEPPPPAHGGSNRPAGKQTLVGIAPASVPPPPPPAPPAAVQAPVPDLPSGLVTAGGTPEGPSGIAKLYKPKDDPAGPPVVLTAEVREAEEATHAELEAQRRAHSSSRHVQTLMNIKVPDVVPYQPKKRHGTWQLLLGVAAGLLVVGVVIKLTSNESPAPLPVSSPAVQAAAPAPEPVVTPAAAERNGPSVTPVAPAEPASPRPVVLPVEAARGDIEGPGSEPAPSRPHKTSASKKVASKTKAATSEPASSPPPSKGGVIVRDTPF